MNTADPGDELTLGLSPCPNDTFMFHGLVHGSGPLRFRPVLEDIESLNRRVVEGEDPPAVSKISVAALGQVSDRYTVLASGAALGRGVGPLVVVRSEAGDLAQLADLHGRRVGIPGAYTTAQLLLRIFGPAQLDRRQLRFEQIMPAVAAGELDAGVIIHESRFTYPAHGLRALADLGELWEAYSGLPLPLGVIVARRDLGEARISAIEGALASSVRAARSDPTAAWPWIRAHAQEMDEEVCRRHIELYVNEFSVELGDEGRAAIDHLLAEGRAHGALPRDLRDRWR